jgi:hypothetical protein
MLFHGVVLSIIVEIIDFHVLFIMQYRHFKLSLFAMAYSVCDKVMLKSFAVFNCKLHSLMFSFFVYKNFISCFTVIISVFF